MQAHWDKVYSTKGPNEVSWYRPHLDRSIALIERAIPNRSARIIDVGGGTSTLVDDLLQLGYSNITVLDISEAAIAVAQSRLRDASPGVRWLRNTGLRLVDRLAPLKQELVKRAVGRTF